MLLNSLSNIIFMKHQHVSRGCFEKKNIIFNVSLIKIVTCFDKKKKKHKKNSFAMMNIPSFRYFVYNS